MLNREHFYFLSENHYIIDMKIFKCIYGDGSIELEKKTQIELDKLFRKYPTGKIEKFENFSASSGYRLYTTIIFETEKSEFNPLILNQLIDSLKDLTNN